MIIGLCSYGNTGSGAVLDLLREYEDFEIIGGESNDFEFKYVYMPDGIEDLEYHINTCPTRWMSSDLAIKRFNDLVEYYGKPYTTISRLTNQKYYYISKEYINNITQCTWKGRRVSEYMHKGKKGILGARIRMKIHSLLYEWLKKDIIVFPQVQMYYSYNNEAFIEISKKYLQDLINCLRKTNKEKIVIDQPFSGDYPEKSFKFYDDPYAIVVDRDPRDLYITAKYVFPGEASWIPKDNIEYFVHYYRTMRSKRNPQNQRIMYVRFEDLIYEYEKTKEKIERFVGASHANGKRFFDPNVSIRNTQIYKMYPQEKDNIMQIENSLSEWLYPFDLYDVEINHDNMF